jgi:hypothetical protein
MSVKLTCAANLLFAPLKITLTVVLAHQDTNQTLLQK